MLFFFITIIILHTSGALITGVQSFALPISALVDAIIHLDDQIGLFVRRRGAIAIAGQFAGDQIGIMAEFDPAFERGVVRLDDEALALRRGKLRLEARDISPERGRTPGQRQRRPWYGGEAQPPEVPLAHGYAPGFGERVLHAFFHDDHTPPYPWWHTGSTQ